MSLNNVMEIIFEWKQNQLNSWNWYFKKFPTKHQILGVMKGYFWGFGCPNEALLARTTLKGDFWGVLVSCWLRLCMAPNEKTPLLSSLVLLPGRRRAVDERTIVFGGSLLSALPQQELIAYCIDLLPGESGIASYEQRLASERSWYR